MLDNISPANWFGVIPFAAAHAYKYTDRGFWYSLFIFALAFAIYGFLHVLFSNAYFSFVEERELTRGGRVFTSVIVILVEAFVAFTFLSLIN